jgi:drug/metabolite transporter (DMT)-like permease
VLIWPVLGSAGATGLALSFAAAMFWAAGTIYLKLVRIPGDTIAITAWQIAIAAVLTLCCAAIFQGWPTFELAPGKALAAAILNGMIGSALCYFLWYHIVGRLPATTAALGTLLSPAIGVVLSALILGEIPSTNDVIGFGLIFAAAMTVILRRPANIPAADPTTRQ